MMTFEVGSHHGRFDSHRPGTVVAHIASRHAVARLHLGFSNQVGRFGRSRRITRDAFAAVKRTEARIRGPSGGATGNLAYDTSAMAGGANWLFGAARWSPLDAM